jgi:tRNA threonylcarbamoyladenosine biosynthesis protein TsaE
MTADNSGSSEPAADGDEPPPRAVLTDDVTTMLTLTLTSPAATRRFARILAGVLEPPCLVTIEGDLGTGKTTLVREVLRARGVRGTVTSPSFTLAQSYRGRDGVALHHLDLYRLSRGADVDLFAWEDYLGGEAITFVEWPAAGSEALPPADVRLLLRHRTPRRRDAELHAREALEADIAEGATAAGLDVALHLAADAAADGVTQEAAAQGVARSAAGRTPAEERA